MATPQLDLTRPPKAMTGLIGGAMDQNQFANAAQEPVAEFMGQAPLTEAPQIGTPPTASQVGFSPAQLNLPRLAPTSAESGVLFAGQELTPITPIGQADAAGQPEQQFQKVLGADGQISQVPIAAPTEYQGGQDRMLQSAPVAYSTAAPGIIDGAAVEPQAASARTFTAPETITRPNAPAPEAQPEAPAPETQERVTNVPATVQRDTTQQGAATGAATGAAGTPSAQGAYETVSGRERIERITPEAIKAETYTPSEVGALEKATAEGYEAGGYEAEKAPDAEGYEAVGYEAEGYEALQGVAKTTAENVSQAITRITGQDSPIMQRAVAQATAEANRRGLLNSSMAAGAAQGAILDRAMQIAQGDVQNEQFNVEQQNIMERNNITEANTALRFSAQARNAASEFMADAKNKSASFLAAERNQNGRFNAEQANDAKEFSVGAANRASEFASAARNRASEINTQEANNRNEFVAQQADAAARFSAEMLQRASEANAREFNLANQRYADAMNAALAAEVDAENLSRRDLARYQNEAEQNRLDRENRLELANISAGASMAAAGAGAAASAANAAAQREFAAGQAALDREFRSAENAASRQFSREQMGAQFYSDMVRQVGSIMQNTNLTQQGITNTINTVLGLGNGHPYNPVNITIEGED